ncbi:MAG: NAD-dependent epimerase/dehydratase family protein [Phycisphaeraceae bacterium]
MFALVTGATGFIGRELVETLAARGHRVRALARSRERAAGLPGSVEVRVGDLAEPETLEGVAEGAEVVFHLGGATGGGGVERHLQVTAEGTRAMLAETCRAGVRRFVHVSSLAVYDLAGQRRGAVIDEQSPVPAPENAAGAYARGKVEAERIVRDAAGRNGPEVTIVRAGLVYGPGRVVFEHLGRPVGPVRVGFGSGDQLLPLVSIRSVVDALLRAAEAPEAAGRTYVLVDPDPPTRRQYLDALGEILGERQRAAYLPTLPVALACEAMGRLRKLPGLARLPATSGGKVRQRALSLRYDAERLERDTGWAPASRDFRDGLRRALEPRPRGHASPALTRRPIRVGLIGTGNNCRHHISALRKLEQVEIVGVLDLDIAAARAAAARAGTDAAFSEPGRFYDQLEPDVVHVVTPPTTHARVAVDALERGVHVLCEKPLAMTDSECRAIEQMARESGRQCGVNLNMLCDPRFRRVQRALQTGVLGELVHVEISCRFDVRRFRHIGDRGHWVHDLPGGLLEDLLPHPLYLALELLGPSAELWADRSIRTGRLPGLDDELRLSLVRRGAPPATANVVLSLAGRPDGFDVRATGTKATAAADLQNMLFAIERVGPGPKAVAKGLMVGRGGAGRLWQLGSNAARLATGRQRPPGDLLPLLRDFYQALERGEPVPVGPERGRATTAMMREVWPGQERREAALEEVRGSQGR